MDRAQSAPCRVGSSGVVGNAFYSEKIQRELALQAARAMGLPESSFDGGLPIQQGIETQGRMPDGPTATEVTGKGRGEASSGAMAFTPVESAGPTVTGQVEPKRTEGRVPVSDEVFHQDAVKRGYKPVENSPQPGSLQRALEGEIVDLLRDQNAKLLSEVVFLRQQVEKQQQGTGSVSSPWSTVGGSDSGAPPKHADPPAANDGFHGCAGVPPSGQRLGRDSSRTPRSKVRSEAVSPCKQEATRYTPNGTRVPDGPPPPPVEYPEVPPFPPQDVGMGINEQLYEPCVSKTHVKNGDMSWKPQNEGSTTTLSSGEAKQVWLEREVQALRAAVNRMDVPQSFKQSAYWSGNWDGSHLDKGLSQPVSLNARSLQRVLAR